MNLLSDKQLSQLKDFISVEMLKRGYTAKIVEFKEVSSNSKRSRIDFHTETFQTTPVMFKELHISSFSSLISLNSELTLEYNREAFGIWIQVSVRYENFSGGSNGTTLFDVSGSFVKGGRIQDLRVR